MVTEVNDTKYGAVSLHDDGRRTNRSEYYCLSTDTKPVDGVNNADVLYEMDTKSVFLYDEEHTVWIKQ